MNGWKYTTWILGILSVTLFFLLWQSKLTLQKNKADLRLARDIMQNYHLQREQALKSDVPQALEYLQRFNIPSGSDSIVDLGNKYIADILGHERRRSVQDIISYLRVKTGKDLGDDPNKWIEGLKAGSASEAYPPR